MLNPEKASGDSTSPKLYSRVLSFDAIHGISEAKFCVFPDGVHAGVGGNGGG